jgi:hypothetical protein
MSCAEWEREIASELDSAELNDHLRVCANCRQFAKELEANRAALRSLEIDAQAFDIVRQRVLFDIHSGKRRTSWWLWPSVAAACAVAFIAAWLRPNFENPGRPPAIEFSKAPPRIEWTVKQAPQRPVPVVARAEPLVVKIFTNDPNVIIIWLVDQKGD